MKFKNYFIFPFFLCFVYVSYAQPVNQFNVDISKVIIQHIPADIKITIPAFKNHSADTVDISINNEFKNVIFKNGLYIFEYQFDNSEELTISIGDQSFSRNITPVPLWMSILPPLVAIFMALVFREVYSALFIGLMVGSVIITFYQGIVFWKAIFFGIFAIIDVYILESSREK